MAIHKCNKEVEIADMKSKVDDLHRVMFEKDGLKENFDKMQGGLSLASWAIGGGVLMSIVSIVIVLLK